MEQISKPKLLVTILNQGWIRPELADVQHLLLSDTRADVKVVHLNKRPSETARNFAVKMMLDGGFDYLLTIDHDTVPLRNPIDLLFIEVDVVGFAYLGMQTKEQGIELAFLGMDKQPNGEYLDHKNQDGLQAVDAVGSGCLLMSRKVLEQVKAPFMRKWNEDGFAITGLDFYFCEKAKELGFQSYCHYGYIADHIKDVSLLNVLKFSYV
jgi:GT2 family glycosyltransferase